MLLPSLLIAAGLAHAKLWGWDDAFTLVVRNMGKNPLGNWYWMAASCQGWGNWCDNQSCKRLQNFNVDLGGVDRKKDQWYSAALQATNYDWAHIERENGAWIDLWRRGDGRFDIFENNRQPAHPHGFCESLKDPNGDGQWHVFCDNGKTDTIIALACYQY